MATINTTFSFTDNVSPGLRNLQNEVGKTSDSFSKMSMGLLSVSSALQIVGQIRGKFQELSASVNECVQAYQYQNEQELKLATIMRQRMGATDAEIQSIKDFASAQQQLGIYGDEVILQGAQELASFTSNTQAIKTLIPAMNNLIAQQYGYSASGKEFQSTADMMGKVLSGQTGALSRMGYVFSEEEKQLLKTGTEMERASVLAKIITDNVGNMNEAMRQTDMGAMQDMTNTIGDLKEELGQALIPFKAMFTLATGNWKIKFYKTLISALNYVNSHPIIKAVLKGTIIAMITSIGSVLALSLIPMLGAVIAKLTIINALSGPIGLIALAIGGITAGVIALEGALKDTKKDGDELAKTLKDVGMSWKEAQGILFDNKADPFSKQKLNAYTVGIAKAEDELNKLYKEHYTATSIDWKTQGIIDPDNLLRPHELEYAQQLKSQYDEFVRKHSALEGIMGSETAMLQKQKELADKINESNQRYKDTLEQIHDEYSKTDYAQKKELEERLKAYEELYNRGFMRVASEGKVAGTIMWENKALTKEQKTELGIVIDELRKKLKTNGSGALKVVDENIVDIADDYRELLAKRATEKFNLQFSQVTPEVNVGGITVNNNTDLDAVIEAITTGVEEAQASSLSS